MEQRKEFAVDAHKTSILLLAAFITAFIVICTMPQFALATSLDELDEALIAKQIEVDERQAEYEQCQQLLGETAAAVYKYAGADRVLAVLTGSESIVDTLKQLEYFQALERSYKEKTEAVHNAKLELEQKMMEAQVLRDERSQRVKTGAEADAAQYAQGDSRWGNVYYWGGTLSWTGCGLCAYTSAIDILTGSDYTPPEMLSIRGDWMGMDHYVNDNTGTPDGSSHHDWTKATFDLETYEGDKSSLLSEIADPNKVAILLVAGSLKQNNGGWWYTSGHYICAYNYDSNGVVHVQDPAGSADLGMNVQYSGDELERLMGAIRTIVIYKN